MMSESSKQLVFEGKPIALTISNRAAKQLQQREASLHVSMELLFSCLIRKRVLFGEEEPAQDSTRLGEHDRLKLYFTPRMTKACHISDLQGAPDSVAFPLRDARRFLPGWLTIDYHPRDGWSGMFGYAGGR